MTFASIRDRVIKDTKRGSVTFTVEGFDRPIHSHAAMYELAVLVGDTNCFADRPILTTLLECGLEQPEGTDPEKHADAMIARLDALLEGSDDDRRDHRLALRWFERFDRSNDLIALTGKADPTISRGLRSPDESERAHILRNVSSPWNQQRALAANDRDLGMMGLGDIRTIFEEEGISDDDRADRLLAAGPDAAMWFDWLCNGGPHPDEGQWYFRWDGDRYYEVIERGTNRVAFNSRWARTAEAIALVLCDHPHLVDDFERQDRARHDDADAQAAWTAIGESLAEWRSANLTFHDPWAPKEQIREPVATAATTSADATSAEATASADGYDITF